MCHFWVFLGEFRDSRIQTSGFESRIHESTSKRFESHESNGKLSQKLFSFRNSGHGIFETDFLSGNAKLSMAYCTFISQNFNLLKLSKCN